MVLPDKIAIKQEKEDYEEGSTALDYKYEVEVDVKVESSLVSGEDWCVKSDQYSSNIESLESDESVADDVIEYEDLIEYNKQKCFRCESSFCESYSLLRHNLKHLYVRLVPLTRLQYQCNDCLRYFKKKSSLENHIWMTHLKREPRKELLIIGNESFKKTKSLHQCNVCGKIFTYKRWNAHIKETHGDGLYKCEKCHKSFKCAKYLRTHRYRVHNRWLKSKRMDNAEKLQCTLCPALLVDKQALKTHMRNCHCEKVRCEICNSMLKKAYLNNHIRRVHYNDGKEYKCKCGKKFRSPRYLKIHIKNSH